MDVGLDESFRSESKTNGLVRWGNLNQLYNIPTKTELNEQHIAPGRMQFQNAFWPQNTCIDLVTITKVPQFQLV